MKIKNLDFYTSFNISIDSRMEFTIREAYNNFDFLSDIGGFFGIIFGTGVYINSIFSSTITKVATAQKLYKANKSQRLNPGEPKSQRDLQKKLQWL